MKHKEPSPVQTGTVPLCKQHKEPSPVQTPEVLITLYKYYIAHNQVGTDWVILPVTNFDAYFGTTAFGRRYLQLLKEANIIETETGYGVSRLKLTFQP